jgi:hypothetical protein
MRKSPLFSALISVFLVALISLSFGSPAHAAIAATANKTDIVRPGQTNTVDLIITLTGLPNIYTSSVSLAGMLHSPYTSGWFSIATVSSSYRTCLGSTVQIQTGIGRTGFCNPNGGTGAILDYDSIYTDVGGTVVFKFPAGSLTFSGSGPYTATAMYNSTSMQTITLTPERTTSTVMFDTNGGTGTMSSQSAASAQALTTNTFTRSGFRFTGWSTSIGTSAVVYNNQASYPFSPASVDQTLYAQWAALTPQMPALAVSSTAGTFGTPLLLTTTGGTGDGAVTFSATNGTATGCSISSGSLSSTSFGTCSVTATKAADITYDSATSSATTVTLDKISRTLSFGSTTDYTLAYGAQQTVAATPSAGVGVGAVTYTRSSGTACTVHATSGVISVTSSSGLCVVSASIAESADYVSANTTTQVTVNGTTKSISITGGSPSVNFGTTPTPTALVSTGSLVGAQSVDHSQTSFTFQGINGTVYGPSTVLPQNAGSYSVLPSDLSITGGSANNYNITYSTGTLTINRVARSLSLGATTNYPHSYGDTRTVTATPSAGDGTVTYSAGSSTACSVNSTSGVITVTAGSGTCEVSATVADGTNHSDASTTTSITITVHKRALTVTAASPSITVGGSVSASYSLTTGTLVDSDAISTITYTYSGTGSTVYVSSSSAPTAVGTYSLTPSAVALSTGLLDDYTISYVAGTLTIVSKTARSISFAVTDYDLTYGDTQLVDATPSLAPSDGSVTYSSGSSTACSVSNSGLISITSASGTCTVSATISEGTSYLSATTAPQVTVVVGARPVSITASDATHTSGALFTPAHTISSGTLAGSETIDGLTYTYVGSGSTTYAASTVAPTTAGTYTITPSVAQLSTGLAANYTFTYVSGTFTISAPSVSSAAKPDAVTPSTTPDATNTSQSNSGTAAPPETTQRASAPKTTIPNGPEAMVDLTGATLVETGSSYSSYLQASALLLLIGVALLGARLSVTASNLTR